MDIKSSSVKICPSGKVLSFSYHDFAVFLSCNLRLLGEFIEFIHLFLLFLVKTLCLVNIFVEYQNLFIIQHLLKNDLSVITFYFLNYLC